MEIIHCNIIFSVLFLSHFSNTVNSWSYHNFDEWGSISNICNTGTKQSPIDLQTKIKDKHPGETAIKFSNYGEYPEELKVTNSGKTVEFTGEWRNKPSISGAIYGNDRYIVAGFHAHWGANPYNGTEHAIEGQEYAVELQIVHYNEKYKDVDDALNYPDGLAIIGILFEVANKRPNKGMSAYASLAQLVLEKKEVKLRKGTLDLGLLIPKEIPPIYVYDGSLTTPPCTENVRWAVLSKPQPITKGIIRMLGNIKLEDHDKGNDRPLQKVNGRLVELDPEN